jgi:uncharacterized protein involved in exopolysaccharide biosynthesis
MKLPRREINYPLALWRRKWLILPFLLLGLAGSGVAFWLMTPLYRAQATVALIQQTISRSIYEGQRHPAQERLRSVRAEVYTTVFLEAVARDLGNKAPTEADLTWIVNGLKVNSPDQETFLFSKTGSDPVEVARIANTAAEVFVRENRNKKIEATAASDRFVVDEIAELEEELKDEKERLAEYQSAHEGRLPMDRETHRARQAMLRSRISELDARIAVARKELDLGRARLENPDLDRLEREAPEAAEPEDHRLAQVRQLREDLSEARSLYTENHPRVIRLQASLDALLEQIREDPEAGRPGAEDGGAGEQPTAGANGREARERALRLDIARLEYEIAGHESQRDNAERQIQELEDQIQASYTVESDLGRMRATISLLEARLLQNRRRLQALERESSIFEHDMDERFILKTAAGIPPFPYRPKLLQLLLVGLAGGAGVGVGLALLRELLDRSVSSAEEVESLLETEILAVIPDLDRAPRRSPRRSQAG